MPLTRASASDSRVTANYQIVEKNGTAGKPVAVGVVPKLFDETRWTRADRGQLTSRNRGAISLLFN